MSTATATTDSTNSAVYDAINKANSTASTRAGTATSETENRFLKLLTTQLKNQDPLNPMDNAQMTSQMAQISTVDGITKLNATLEKLISNSNENQTMQAAGLVNHAVLVPGSSLALGDKGAVGGVELKDPVDTATVTIKDANNVIVRTLELGALEPGSHTFTWDGKTNNDEAAAPGNYTISVEAKRGGEKVDVSALSAGLVSSVERSASGMTLNIDGLGSFAFSAVREIL